MRTMLVSAAVVALSVGFAPAASGADVVGGARLGAPGVIVSAPAGVPAPPAPQAVGWLVADLDTGKVLAASQPHRPLAPASTLKVLTAVSLIPLIAPEAVHTGTPADASIDGSKVGIVPGSRYTRADLLNGMLLGSGNDCATALGDLAGGEKEATEAMNAEARRLGAADTVAATPSGLDAPGQVSSAYDLALIARAAFSDPTVGPVMRTQRYRFPAGGAPLDASRKRFQIQNHNKLLFNYPGATGGKTGYTVAARHSFIGSADRGGRRYVVTLLRDEGVPWSQAGKLLDWAYAYGGRVRPVGELVSPEQVASAARQQAAARTGATAVRSAALPEPRPTVTDSWEPDVPVLAGGTLVLLALLAIAWSTGLLPLGRIGGSRRHRT